MGCATEEGGIKKAEPIVFALEFYKEDNKVYPDKLDDLVPLYIDRIPFQFKNECTFYSNGIDGQSYAFEYVIQGSSARLNCYYEEIGEWMVFGSGGCMPLEYYKENSP